MRTRLIVWIGLLALVLEGVAQQRRAMLFRSPEASGGGGGTNTLLQGLVAYWRMDETSGNRSDAHTGTNTLTDNNTVGFTASGKSGNAAEFIAANSEYLSIGTNFLAMPTNNTPFTVCGWINWNQFVDITGVCAGQGLNWYVMYRDSIRFRIGGTSDTIDVAISGLTTNTWYFFSAGTAGGGASDGWVQLGTNRANGLFRTFINTGGMDVGRYNGGNYIGAKIDELSVHNRALSSNEISQIYNANAGKFYPY